MSEFNPIYYIIHYNKWRFIMLLIGMVIIIGALIAALILDPLPLWGTLIASGILAGAVGTTIWHIIKFRKYEKETDWNELN